MTEHVFRPWAFLVNPFPEFCSSPSNEAVFINPFRPKPFSCPGLSSSLRSCAGHIFHTWKKRWFVLDKQLLKYYKSSTEDANLSISKAPQLSELKGCINLLNCQVDALGRETETRPFCFRITPMSNKVCFCTSPCSSDPVSCCLCFWSSDFLDIGTG